MKDLPQKIFYIIVCGTPIVIIWAITLKLYEFELYTEFFVVGFIAVGVSIGSFSVLIDGLKGSEDKIQSQRSV